MLNQAHSEGNCEESCSDHLLCRTDCSLDMSVYMISILHDSIAALLTPMLHIPKLWKVVSMVVILVVILKPAIYTVVLINLCRFAHVQSRTILFKMDF